jgi:transposase-like protein
MAAKNQVQFQAGMSLMGFLDRYGSEEQCREALAQARWPKGFRCPDCGESSHCHLKRRNVHQCNRCKRQVSLTSGTVFAETKLPLRTWFLAIYLLTQHKNGISALALRRQLGVSYNTAWLLKHKLMQAMVERDSDFALGGIVPMDDAY